MVKGAIIVAQEFLKHKSDKNAALINISSSATQMGVVPGLSAYASAKLGVGKAMEYLQSENPDVRVVNVHPGVIESDMSRTTKKAYGIEFEYDECELILFGRGDWRRVLMRKQMNCRDISVLGSRVRRRISWAGGMCGRLGMWRSW